MDESCSVLLALGLAVAPRFFLVLAWIFSARWPIVWQGDFLIPLLGIIFAPYTTIMYLLVWTPTASRARAGYGSSSASSSTYPRTPNPLPTVSRSPVTRVLDAADVMGLYMDRRSLSHIAFIHSSYRQIVPVHGVMMFEPLTTAAHWLRHLRWFPGLESADGRAQP